MKTLETRFKNRGRVVAKSFPGATSRAIINEENLFKASENTHVVIMIGSNDACLRLDQLPEKQAELLKSWKEDNSVGVPVEEFVENLKTLVQKAHKESGDSTVVYLVSVAAVHEEKRLKSLQAQERKYTEHWEDITVSDRNNDNNKVYRDAVEQLALETGSVFIDIFTSLNEDAASNLFDGVHPTKEGNSIIADLIIKGLEKQLGYDEDDEEEGWTYV